MQQILRLLPYIKNYWRNISLNIASNLLMVLFSIASIPIFIPFFDILLGDEELVTTPPTSIWSQEGIKDFFYYHLSQVIQLHGKERALIYICISIVLIYFFKNLFRYLSLFFMAPVRNGIVRDLRQDVFEKMMVLPLSYFSEERKGDLMARITADVQEVEYSVLSTLEVIVRAPLMIVGSIILMLLFSVKLTLFSFVLLIFTVVVIGGLGRTLRRQSTDVQEKLGDLVSTIEEGLSGLKVIKGFNAKNYQSEKFGQENTTYFNLLNRLLWRRDMASPMSEFLGVATVAVLIWFGFREVQAGTMNVSVFITFLYAFYGIIDPAKMFSKASYNIRKGLAALDRVEEILDAPIDIQEVQNPIPISTFEKEIVFQDVSFRYKNGERDVLQEINLVIPKGEIIALVGISGGGKSTLVDLLPRFQDVTKGAILIDGTNIKHYKLHDLRSLFGIVTQEAVLFNDSVQNNIIFGKNNISEQSVQDAAKVANAHEFIKELDQHYETFIGDRGSKLSGGQRQRLTIARAILRDPPILILDEATSALDAESEKLVQEALQRIMKDRTALVIAHRLSTIQHAHKIIVLKEGRIVEQGTHAQLINQNGEYKKLVDLQTF